MGSNERVCMFLLSFFLLKGEKNNVCKGELLEESV